MKLNVNNQRELELWEQLESIFEDFDKISNRLIKKLETLGFEVAYTGKHPKMYVYRNGKRYCITLSCTPSDKYAGRQILRQIRKVYERG